MTGSSEWRGAVGDVWAREWQRTDRSFSDMTPTLIDTAMAIAPVDAAKLLDIGCGAGSTSFALAERLPGTQMLGIDISPSLVETAQARAAEAGGRSDCQFKLADASLWADVDYRPDLLMSRHGVMFFDDPIAAFTSLHDASADGAALTFSCFAAPQDNIWLTEVNAILPHAEALPKAGVPGPFGFSDADLVYDILSSAGWREAQPRILEFSYIAGEGATRDAAVEDAIAFFKRIGPVARAIRELDGDERDALIIRLAGVASRSYTDGIVALPGSVAIWTARRG